MCPHQLMFPKQPAREEILARATVEAIELKTKGQFLKSTVVITNVQVVLFPDSITMSHGGQALFTHPDTQGKSSLVHTK